jgi:WD40 repeat protein
MPHVVCQVRATPERITLVWSEGQAFFEPSHLASRAAEELGDLGRRAREQLSRLAAEPDQAAAGFALAEIGHRIFRHLFPVGEAGPAREIQGWLTRLESQGALDSLEILGDHEILPWNLMYDAPPEENAFAWQRFWGARLNLSTGRRAGSLRPVRELEKPNVLLVIDPRLRDSLAESQQKRLHDFITTRGLSVVESLADFGRAVRAQPPDLLYLLCRTEPGGLAVGDSRLTSADLEDLLRGDYASAIPWSSRLLFVNACGAGPAGVGWHSLGLGGLIVPEVALPADFANAFGLDLLVGFLYQGEPVGRLMQKLRERTGPLGLAYSASCPPGLRVTWEEGGTAEPAAAAEQPSWPPLPDKPYRPVRSYDREDRALFVGRENDTTLVADLLDAPATRLVLVHGRMAVGKSSLLRAGVLPYLEEEGVGYLALRDRSEEDAGAIIAVRTTNDLPGQLALALSAACARAYTYTTPAGKSVAVDLPAVLRQMVTGQDAAVSTSIQVAQASLAIPFAGPPPLPAETAARPLQADVVRAALCADPSLLGRLLATLAERLPHEPVVLIEQGEEVFTLARREDVDNRAIALEMLRRTATGSGPGKVLVSLRTEYYGRLVNLLRRGTLEPGGVRDYFLTEMDEERMLAAVLQPTVTEPVAYSTEVPFQKYGFRYEDGFAELLVREVRQTARERQESPLALLQVVCAQLADLAQERADRVIRQADLDALGGAAGAMERFIDQRLKALELTKAATRLKDLLGKLAVVQPDGTITRGLVSEDELAEGWRGPTPLSTVLDQGAEDDTRLFETYWLGPQGSEQRHVSLSHAALATVAARWEREEKIRRAHGRKVMIDWLWVVIPLGLLVVVLGWLWYTYQYIRVPNLSKDVGQAENKLEVAMRQQRELQLAVDMGRWPLYVAQMGQAEELARQGDVLRLRQLLLHFRESPRPPDDIRGFEWYHFWLLADRSRATLQGHQGRIGGVALSADSKVLATASADGTVRLWNVDPPGQRATLRKPGNSPLNALALSADGKTLAAGDDQAVLVWDLAMEKANKAAGPLTLKGHKGPILSVALTPDGKHLASGSGDGTVLLRDLPGGKVRATLPYHKGPVHALAFSADGKRLASAGEAGAVFLYDDAGKKLNDFTGSDVVYALAFSPDGKTLAAGGEQLADGFMKVGDIWFWETASGKKKERPFRLPAPVISLAYAGDGKTLAVGCQDKAIHLWDLAEDKERNVLRGHLGWVTGLAWSADGKTLASGGLDSAVKLWSSELPGARQILAGPKGGTFAAAVSPDGKLLAAAGADGTIRLWDAATGKEARTLKDAPSPARSIAFGWQDKKLVILASAHAGHDKQDGAVVLWDAASGAVLRTLKGHHGSVNSVALSADGSLLASGGADKAVLVWDVRKGALQHKLTGHEGEVLSVVLSPDGKRLASGGADGVIRLWNPQAAVADLAKGPVLTQAHAGAVAALAFAPDGTELASAGYDGLLKRWDPIKGKFFIALKGHAGPVLAVAYSPQGETLLTGGMDQTVRLWDVPRIEPRFTFTGHGGAVRGVAFSPDRRLLVSADQNGSVRLWRAAPEEPGPVVVREAAPGRE